MRRVKTLTSIFVLLAGSAMAQDEIVVWDIQSDSPYTTINEGQVVKTTGYYGNTGIKGAVLGLDTFTVDGTYIGYAHAHALIEANQIKGSGKIVSQSHLVVSQIADMSGFTGTVELDSSTAVQEPTFTFTNSKNAPLNTNFVLGETSRLQFVGGDYTLNGKISGNGLISLPSNPYTIETVENKTPTTLTIKGDISNFSGAYYAENGTNGPSTIKIETTLNDSVTFTGANGASLELVGKEGDSKKTITVNSVSSVSTSGNVYMNGNDIIIARNDVKAYDLDDRGGTIFLGGNNSYIANTKVEKVFNSTNVIGETGGHFAMGGRGAGSVLNNGASAVIDGVEFATFSGAGVDGAKVNGDIYVEVKNDSKINTLFAGGYGVEHKGNTNVSISGGEITEYLIVGGASATSQVGDVNLEMTGGTVKTIYGTHYSAASAVADSATGLKGNINMNITGGTITGQIRAGVTTNNSGNATDAQARMVVNGDVNVFVGGDAKVGLGNSEAIRATGTYGSINGAFNVVVSENAQVGGIRARGSSGTIKSVNITLMDNAIVEGMIDGGNSTSESSILNIGTDSKGYTGTISVKEFDKIFISAGSKVEFAKEFNVESLVIEIPQVMLFSRDVQVSLVEGTTFDTLTVVGFDEASNTISLDSIFGDSVGVVLAALENNNTSLTVIDSNGQEWTTENISFDDNNISFELGTAIPEPSTLAMILSSLALGFVIYRRKK